MTILSKSSEIIKGFPGGSDDKESACNAWDSGSIPGSGRSPGEGMRPDCSFVAWRILWTEELDGLQSMGFRRAGRATEWLTHTERNTYIFGVHFCFWHRIFKPLEFPLSRVIKVPFVMLIKQLSGSPWGGACCQQRGLELATPSPSPHPASGEGRGLEVELDHQELILINCACLIKPP